MARDLAMFHIASYLSRYTAFLYIQLDILSTVLRFLQEFSFKDLQSVSDNTLYHLSPLHK